MICHTLPHRPRLAMVATLLSCLFLVPGGCPTQQPLDTSNQNGNGNVDDSSSGRTVVAPEILLEQTVSLGKLAAGRPAISEVSGTFENNGLLAGAIRNVTFSCRVSDSDGIRAVVANLAACGGPSEASFAAPDGSDLFEWSGTLSPGSAGVFVCPLTATTKRGASVTLQLLVVVDGAGSSLPVPIAATGFLTCVIEPTSSTSASTLDVSLNGSALFSGLSLSFPNGKQFVPTLVLGPNALDIRGRAKTNALRVRFLQGVDLLPKFDGIIILGLQRAASFSITRTSPGQRLEDVTVSSAEVELTLVDYGAQDGDRIDLLINERPVLTDHTLLNAGTKVHVALNRGSNLVRVRALNEGTSSPNTARISVSGAVGGPTSQSWGLLTGEEATFEIIR